MSIRTAVPAAALALLVLAGCSEEAAQDAVDDARDRASQEARSALEDADLPDVDWQSYSGDLKERLDGLAENADCSALQKELDKVEPNSEVADYIEAQLRELDC